MKWKIGIPLALVILGIGGFLLLKPHGYSWNHPWVLHDCRMMASECPSHQAEWAPPGGGAYSVYGDCACSATTHGLVG